MTDNIVMSTILMLGSRHLVGILFTPGCLKNMHVAMAMHIFFALPRVKNRFDSPCNTWLTLQYDNLRRY